MLSSSISSKAELDDSILPIDGEPDTDIIEIRKALGESVCLKQTRNRNFIAKTQKETPLQDLIESFLSTSSSYLSHKDFPKKFIAKEYKKHLNWNTASYGIILADTVSIIYKPLR